MVKALGVGYKSFKCNIYFFSNSIFILTKRNNPPYCALRQTAIHFYIFLIFFSLMFLNYYQKDVEQNGSLPGELGLIVI